MIIINYRVLNNEVNIVKSASLDPAKGEAVENGWMMRKRSLMTTHGVVTRLIQGAGGFLTLLLCAIVLWDLRKEGIKKRC